MISPSFVYFSVWLAVIWLQSLNIIGFYEPVNVEFVIIQIIAIVILAASEILVRKSYRKQPQTDELQTRQLKTLHLFKKKLLPLLIAMFFADALWSGGFPLLWLAAGDGRGHVDFGIPTFHGAFHGILLFFATSSFVLFRKNFHRRENLLHICLFFIYAIIVFNRGIVVIFMIQVVFISLITSNKIRFFNIFGLGILFVVFVLVFGMLGDFRSGGNVFYSSISNDWEDFFEILPGSLLWFYTYSTGGLNNLYYNITTLDPTYDLQFTFAKLVPTIIYEWMDMPKAYDSFTLADGRLTVSTAFQGLVSDFGLLGILGYLPVVFFAQICFRKALLGSTFFVMLYGMLMQTVIMTPYIDTVFYLTFLLQLMLVIYLLHRCPIHRIKQDQIAK